METAFSIVLLVLLLLFYLPNPHNSANRWCSLAGLFFWLGIVKESLMFNILPALQDAMNTLGLCERFMPVYSVFTWALYSLAMPTVTIFALYFNNWDKTRTSQLRLAKMLIYMPALFISFFFPPHIFRQYQLSSLSFWVTYSVYNLSFGIVFACFMLKGVKLESPGKYRAQKRRIRIVILPPVLFWIASIFLTHPFRLMGLLKLWQVNAVILLICVVLVIVAAFKDGFMGLRLSGETYDWNTNMDIINTGAQYTNHMLKNQTSKMELCIDHLSEQFKADNLPPPEELAILSRSIATLKSYADQIKRHSQSIYLLDEPCRLKELLNDAIALSLMGHAKIKSRTDIDDNIYWTCDRNHMTEVFTNIITNAAEAIRGEGSLVISGVFGKSRYMLSISDDGKGMTEEELLKIFTPHFTTKHTGKNFGLGLAYCKRVVEKHGGGISVKSARNIGTTVTITFPKKRVSFCSVLTEA